MEDTNDKSFVIHSFDKPFIRTMEDDLKKIKNIPAGNGGVNSVASSLSSASFQASNPLKDTKQPSPSLDSNPILTATPITNFSSKSSPKIIVDEVSFVADKPETPSIASPFVKISEDNKITEVKAGDNVKHAVNKEVSMPPLMAKPIKPYQLKDDSSQAEDSNLASAKTPIMASRLKTDSLRVKTPIFTSNMAPKNLPIDMDIAVPEKEKTEFESNKEIEKETQAETQKSIERSSGVIDSGMQDEQVFDRLNLIKNKPLNEKKSALVTDNNIVLSDLNPDETSQPTNTENKQEKNIFRSKSFNSTIRSIPIASNPVDKFSRKTQSSARFSEENEKMSPEARLARKLSAENNDNGIDNKESLLTPQFANRIAQDNFKQPSKANNLSNSTLPTPDFFRSKLAIEDVIKEDGVFSYIRKISKLFFVFLVVAGISYGAYYFFTSKKPIVVSPVITDPNLNKALIEGATEVIIITDLNTDLNNEIKLSFSDTKPAGIYRLTLKNKKDQSGLKLENFKKSLNMVLPDYIFSSFGGSYNLLAFNYPEKNYLRLGLVLKIKNSSDIIVVAKNWEESIYNDIKPMFFDNFGNYEKGKQFNSNKYNGFDIRYLPLGIDNVALNYAIDADKKFLLIATSKDDIFNLIDKTIKGN